MAAVATVGLLAGCASSGQPSAHHSASARDWLVANSLAVRLMVGHAADLELVLNDPAERTQYAAAVVPACRRVLAVLPAPDAPLNDDVRRAVDLYLVGAENADNGSVAAAAADLQRGDAAVDQAKSRARQLGHDIYS